MTTLTEQAIIDREKASRDAAKKRKIGKYAKGAFDLDEYIEDDEAEAAETGKPKAKKS
jgi:hypothetical protein